MKRNALIFTLLVILYGSLASGSFAQNNFDGSDAESKLAKANAIISKTVKLLGGEKYLNVKTTIGEGKFSQLKDGVNVSFQSFTDVIVNPDKERTDFIESGSKIVQVNTGETGWIYEEYLESFRDQDEKAIANFKTVQRSGYDFLLRGNWKDDAQLSYEGRRQASLGKRNDVLKLTFSDGFEVEYEFSDKGLPMKTLYKRFDAEKKEIVEENRYARYISYQGILTPTVIDHYTDGVQTYRVNFENVRYDQRIDEEIFVKPADPKVLRKKLKL
ncbi:MAG: hypothetical protein KDB79_04565 [Acidobacteria bacterium]|nr:hypothetical protein [Acidobacteriota bacterium]